LRRADTGSAEGRDRAIAALRPVLAELPASVLREELVQRIAGRLDLSLARLTDLLAGRAAPRRNDGVDEPTRGETVPAAASVAARPPELDTATRAERAFLVMCVAVPEAGNRALAEIDIDELIRSDAFRGAAHHLAGRCERPLSDLPPHDDALARTVADLVGRAGRADDVTIERLEHARLMLERARIERAIRRARVDGRAGIAALARERESVLAAIHQVVSRLERTV
jgi:DNA primase